MVFSSGSGDLILPSPLKCRPISVCVGLLWYLILWYWQYWLIRVIHLFIRHWTRLFSAVYNYVVFICFAFCVLKVVALFPTWNFFIPVSPRETFSYRFPTWNFFIHVSHVKLFHTCFPHKTFSYMFPTRNFFIHVSPRDTFFLACFPGETFFLACFPRETFSYMFPMRIFFLQVSHVKLFIHVSHVKLILACFPKWNFVLHKLHNCW